MTPAFPRWMTDMSTKISFWGKMIVKNFAALRDCMESNLLIIIIDEFINCALHFWLILKQKKISTNKTTSRAHVKQKAKFMLALINNTCLHPARDFLIVVFLMIYSVVSIMQSCVRLLRCDPGWKLKI